MIYCRGIITAFKHFQTKDAIDILRGIFALLVAAGFGFAGFADLFMITKVNLAVIALPRRIT